MTEKTHLTPKPIFDTIEIVIDQYKSIQTSKDANLLIQDLLNHIFNHIYNHIYNHSDSAVPSFALLDFKLALYFLYSYRGSKDTFSSYRRDLERFLQWSWFIKNESILNLQRNDIESFIEFCLSPPKHWIGHKKVARFKNINGGRTVNPDWRPFDCSPSKTGNKQNYKFSQQSLKALFGILSSFYNFLLQETAVTSNPVAMIRQKSKFIVKDHDVKSIRRLSTEQWTMVINLAKEKAANEIQHERGVFILSCLYGMYLRISELIASERWTPTMGDFFKDQNNHWWFKTVSKGNKARRIAVSDSMLEALKHYRVNYLGLAPYPSLNDQMPLVGHLKNSNHSLTSDRAIRRLVQFYFDAAAEHFEQLDKPHEAESLRAATVHWLRHTGISDDVKIRPREHVRDDAGHSSGAVTDRYIDVELNERAKSAKDKNLVN